MAKEYKIELTDAEVRGMEHIAVDPQEWVENAMKDRARIAMEQLYNEEVEILNADPDVKKIPADRDEVIMNSKIPNAKERNSVEEK